MARVQEQNASLSSAVYSNKQPEVTDDELQRMLKTNGPPISPEAQIIIEDAATGYAEDLVLEAARLARRENLQQIGTAHVKEAQKRLLSIDRRNWTKRLCGSTGGGASGYRSCTIHLALGRNCNSCFTSRRRRNLPSAWKFSANVRRQRIVG